jgi:hypothetical protein
VDAVVIVVTSLISKLIQSWRDRLDSKVQRKKVLKRRMQDAPSYAEWKALARELEKVEGHDPRDTHIRWRKETKLYDRKLLQDKLTHLRKVRAGGDVKDMMFALRTDLIRNVGNIASRCACMGCCAQVLAGNPDSQQRSSALDSDGDVGMSNHGHAASCTLCAGMAACSPLPVSR